MKIVSVILARGGSKGIPQKNIVTLNGKPLIQYSIDASNNSNVEETWVSTDCSKIKKISLSLGANVLDRPTHLATDISSSDSALLHFAENVDFEILAITGNDNIDQLCKDAIEFKVKRVVTAKVRKIEQSLSSIISL